MIFTPNLYPSIVAGHILERTSINSQTPKGRCHILAWWPLITSQSSIFQVHIVQGSIQPDEVSVTVVHHDPPSWIFVHDLSHLPSHTLYPPGSFLHFTHLTWHTLYHPYCPLNIHCSICKLFATSLSDKFHFLVDMFACFSMEVSYFGKSLGVKGNQQTSYGSIISYHKTSSEFWLELNLLRR